MQIECLLNPGVFRYDGKVWMLVRVAERPAQAEGEVSFPLLDAQNRVTVMRVPARVVFLKFLREGIEQMSPASERDVQQGGVDILNDVVNKGILEA